MITLPEPPRLTRPTTAVRTSFLTGEQADCLLRELPSDWLGPASQDFDAYVAQQREVNQRWGVSTSIFWYVAGEHYLGSLVIRHDLTPELFVAGGHIGYHVSPPWRRQGHATAMLAAGVIEARRLGIDRILLTCDPDNEPSQRVITANGGQPDETLGAELRFWIVAG